MSKHSFKLIVVFFLLIASAQTKAVNSGYLLENLDALLISHIEKRGFTIDSIAMISDLMLENNFKLNSVVCYYKMNRCRIDVLNENKLNVSLWYQVKTRSKASFTNRNLYKGDNFSRQDITVKYGNNFRCGSEVNTVKFFFSGKVNNKIKNNTVVCKSDVSPMSSIFKGDDLKLISTFNNVLLEIKVRAVSSGMIGDEIDVLIKSSGKIIKAKILSNNTAEYID